MASEKIVLQGQPVYLEGKTASEVITPGDVIEPSSATAWRKHSTAAANAAAFFAVNPRSKEIGDNYAIGDNVLAAYCPGCKVNAFIGSGQNVSFGAFLESAGDGTLRTLATDAATDQAQREAVVAISLEGSGGAVAAKTRLPVWVL